MGLQGLLSRYYVITVIITSKTNKSIILVENIENTVSLVLTTLPMSVEEKS